MAADAFTQIRNAVFRDSRLSAKAMGIFGNISTHRDGWGITPESISAQMRDGVDSVKAGLRELEKYVYLKRDRERRKNGTLGAATYYITDQPAMDSSSEPEGDFPPQAEPPQVEPPLGDPVHKKTIPLQEDHSVEDELSLPSLPAQRSDPDPVHEREISSSIKPSTPQQLLRAANVVTLDEEEAFTAWVVATHKPRSTAWWRTVAANGDLPDLAAQWRATGGRLPLTGTDATVSGWLALADQLAAKDGHQPYRDNVWDDMRHQLASGSRPDGWERYPHCGHPDCDPITRGREVEDGSGLKSLTWCTACHPNLQF
jgi:hypothetical protein